MPTRMPGVYGIPPGPRRPDRFASKVLELSPTGYWKLGDATASTIGVDEVGTYSGTYSGSPQRGLASIRPVTQSTSIKITDNSIGFQGPVLPTITNWSFCLWTKIVTTGAFSFHITFGTVGGAIVRIGSGNGVFSYSEGSGWSYGSTPFTVNEVAFIAATWDGATVRMYKNGVYVENGARIGRSIPAQACSFPGGSSGGAHIQDVALWSRVLSAAEIKALYLAAAG